MITAVKPYSMFNQRVSSTKTRIKTYELYFDNHDLKTIKEYHPLKQGLRPGVISGTNITLNIKEYHPLKQGLRPVLL